MNAPAIWIGLPLFLTIVFIIPMRSRLTAVLGGLSALTLAGLAFLIPINTAIRIGDFSFKIEPVFVILGRQLLLGEGSQSLLVFVYGMSGLWFLGSDAAGVARRLVPLGMAIAALLVAALSVEPFLYAALLIEMAVLLAVPLLTLPHQTTGRGVIRFVIYQTLAMPFILFSGWLLAGVESSPGDLTLAVQSTVLLGLGFAFLLAVFPLYAWLPLLAEDAPPYALGFLQWILPITALLFGMGFIDRYAWLRTSAQLADVLRLAGLLMVVSGGVWAAFQHRLDRMPAYAAIAETGYALLALSLEATGTVQIVTLLFIPRAFGLAVWTLGLSILKNKADSLYFETIQGLMHTYPLVTGSLILSHLSLAGLPLLAGFPPRLVLWEAIAAQSLGTALWVGMGMLGLFIGAIRSLRVLVMAADFTFWQSQEDWPQRILLGMGVVVLFLLGLFPQIIQPIMSAFPLLFQHLGQ